MNLPTRTAEVKLKSMADLRALSLSLRDARLKQRESDFFAIFERLKSGPLQHIDKVTLAALRYAVRMTWAKDDFEAIVRAGQHLPREVLHQDPVLTAYVAAAQEELDARSRKGTG